MRGVHAENHISAIEAATTLQRGLISLNGDTFMNPFTLEAACCVAGAFMLAIDLVMTEQVENVFCN